LGVNEPFYSNLRLFWIHFLMIHWGHAVSGPGKHAEALLVGVLPEQGFGTRGITLADRFHNGVMAAMSPEQQVKCACDSHLVEYQHGGCDKRQQVQPVDNLFQQRRASVIHYDPMKPLIHDAV
jgi:hypothetical protein